MQTEDHQMQKRQLNGIRFINSNTVNEWTVNKRVKDTEENLLQSVLRHQNKGEIFFPYNFK